MNSPPPFTLRIRTEQEQDIDWMVQPDEITFHQALEVIQRILPNTSTTAFQYVDDDGEKITVRSDDELNAMFQMYFCCLSEDDVARGLLPPLIIYPRVGKSPKDINIHHLKIKTAKHGPRLLTDVLPGGHGGQGDVKNTSRISQLQNLQSSNLSDAAMSPPPGSLLGAQHHGAGTQNLQSGIRLQGQPYRAGNQNQPMHGHPIGAGSQSIAAGTHQHMQSGAQLQGQPYLAGNQNQQMHGHTIGAGSQSMDTGTQCMQSVTQLQGQPFGAGSQNQHLHGHTTGAGTQSVAPGTQSHVPTHGARNQAENIKQILTCGSIVEADLQQLELLGRGNGGLVYKAVHRPTQRIMAVKVIELDVEIEVQKKIISELEILYRCHSPSIIEFYGAYFVENHISICTEYMDGGSLDRYGKVPEHVLGFMAVQIISGLLYMWNEKILHRDIKPSNMLVSQSGDVKLCDFGVSTQLVESIAQTYVGTNAYMAPERIKAETYGVPSEIWSLGVSMFELATGEFPFKELAAQSNPYQLCKSILEETTPVLPAGQFSPELVDFVARCMQKVAKQRITQMELMAHPYIQRYSNDGTNVISSWVKTQTPEAQPS